VQALHLGQEGLSPFSIVPPVFRNFILSIVGRVAQSV